MRRKAFVASSILAVACSRDQARDPTQPLAPAPIDAGTTTAAPPPPTSAKGPVVDPLVENAVKLLAPYALTHGDVPRRTIYTWTTRDQVAAFKKNARLLTREESPTNGAAYLDQILQRLAKNGDPLGKILYTSTFARMRYAWHAPFATRQGWSGEQYGEELIKVTLKPESIILSLFTRTGKFVARDLGGRVLPNEAVTMTPQRIAAIYFVSESFAVAPSTLAGIAPRTTYREIALCNESMIESWSIGTPDIAKELEENAAALDAFASYLRALAESPVVPPLAEAWDDTPAREPIPLYRASLAFDNELYRPDAAEMSALATRLRATPHEIVFSATPTFPFPGPGTARAAPTIKKPPRGTFSTFGTFGKP